MSTLTAHLSQALAASPVQERPAPYVFLENAFPAEQYIQLGEGFRLTQPVFREQVHKGDPKIFFGSYADRLEARVPVDIEGLAPDVAHTWTALKEELESLEFLAALIRKFEAGFRSRFGAKADNPADLRASLRPTLLLTTHRPGYYLGPHTDRFEKVVTCVFNVAEREGLDHLGTTMYEPKQAGFTCNGTIHHDPDLFKPIGLAPYRPNSALIFFRDDRLFHGVERLTEEKLMGSLRPNIQFNLWRA